MGRWRRLERAVAWHHATAHQTFFHPHSQKDGKEGVPAMRLGKYKAFWVTQGSKPCREADGTHRSTSGVKKTHDPPLIFDLDADPSESTPIDAATIPDVVAQIRTAYDNFWLSVNSTMRSTTDYSQNREFAPCGNTSSPSCRTRATDSLAHIFDITV